MLAIGVDIGGTKCAVNIGRISAESVEVLYKANPRKTSDYKPLEMLSALAGDIEGLIRDNPDLDRASIAGIGVSCGGPLDSKSGLILSPPNLPGWNKIPVVDFLVEKTGYPTWLCNDANACALAEWLYGAGQRCSNLIFLTFGTGLGAGLILNSKLYVGASDLAGEVGHIRLAEFGPSGYGKVGSFEGFCSGGGIVQLSAAMIRAEWQQGHRVKFCPDVSSLNQLTTETVGLAAKTGEPLALDIMATVGRQLGKGLAILVDTLNPDCIVLGSIFARSHSEIWPAAHDIIMQETLAEAYSHCRIVPGELGEQIGDCAGLVIVSYNAGLVRSK